MRIWQRQPTVDCLVQNDDVNRILVFFDLEYILETTRTNELVWSSRRDTATPNPLKKARYQMDQK
jgi:hypothetical protein